MEFWFPKDGREAFRKVKATMLIVFVVELILFAIAYHCHYFDRNLILWSFAALFVLIIVESSVFRCPCCAGGLLQYNWDYPTCPKCGSRLRESEYIETEFEGADYECGEPVEPPSSFEMMENLPGRIRFRFTRDFQVVMGVIGLIGGIVLVWLARVQFGQQGYYYLAGGFFIFLGVAGLFARSDNFLMEEETSLFQIRRRFFEKDRFLNYRLEDIECFGVATIMVRNNDSRYWRGEPTYYETYRSGLRLKTGELILLPDLSVSAGYERKMAVAHFLENRRVLMTSANPANTSSPPRPCDA